MLKDNRQMSASAHEGTQQRGHCCTTDRCLLVHKGEHSKGAIAMKDNRQMSVRAHGEHSNTVVDQQTKSASAQGEHSKGPLQFNRQMSVSAHEGNTAKRPLLREASARNCRKTHSKSC